MKRRVVLTALALPLALSAAMFAAESKYPQPRFPSDRKSTRLNSSHR